MYVDIDECIVGIYNCGENFNCINDIGLYYCDCKIGFFGDGEICEGERYFEFDWVKVGFLVLVMEV